MDCVVVQLLSHVWLFATSLTVAHNYSLSFNVSQSLLKLMSIEARMPSNHLSSVGPNSSCLQSFPASGSFQMSKLFASGGQSIGVSFSKLVFPMNIQDWFLKEIDLGWTGWISLQSKGLSRVSSNTAVQDAAGWPLKVPERSQAAWVWITDLPHNSCVTLGKVRVPASLGYWIIWIKWVTTHEVLRSVTGT